MLDNDFWTIENENEIFTINSNELIYKTKGRRKQIPAVEYFYYAQGNHDFTYNFNFSKNFIITDFAIFYNKKEQYIIMCFKNDKKQLKALKIFGHRNYNDISFDNMSAKDLKTLCIDIALNIDFDRIKAFQSVENCKILSFKTDKNHQRI